MFEKAGGGGGHSRKESTAHNRTYQQVDLPEQQCMQAMHDSAEKYGWSFYCRDPSAIEACTHHQATMRSRHARIAFRSCSHLYAALLPQVPQPHCVVAGSTQQQVAVRVQQ